MEYLREKLTAEQLAFIDAYRAFDRKYKKNLKALYLVHPTNFIRVVYNLFKPVIR